MKRCIDCGAELEDDARFCSDCGASQPEIVDEEAGETLPAVMGAKSWKRVERIAKTRVAGERMLDTLHRAVETATGGAKFLGRVVEESDATVVCREEQFKCCLPGDAMYRGSKGDLTDDSIDSNASAVIVGLDVPDSSVVKKIIIPSKIEGLPVVGIADEAFKELLALEEVTLPDSIAKIGDQAFLGCTNLKSINLSKSLSGIFGFVFDDFTAPNRFASSGWLHDSTFEGCSSLSLKSRSLLRNAGYRGSF